MLSRLPIQSVSNRGLNSRATAVEALKRTAFQFQQRSWRLLRLLLFLLVNVGEINFLGAMEKESWQRQVSTIEESKGQGPRLDVVKRNAV